MTHDCRVKVKFHLMPWLVLITILVIAPAPLRAACPINLDVYQLHHYSYRATKYDIAMEILNYFRPHLPLAQVGVGIFDVGFYENPQVIGQFLQDEYSCAAPLPSDADFDTMSDERRSYWEKCMHGPTVTSILSAVNGDGGINGYLAPLQDGTDSGLAPVYFTYAPEMRRTLRHIDFWADANVGDLRLVITNVRALIAAGAEVISMSVRFQFSPSDHDEIAQGRREWQALLNDNPDVVFLVSAGNSNRELYPEEFPQSVTGANQIVVGGLQADDDGGVVRWSGSNYGPGVHIYAPAHQIPAAIGRGFDYIDGTSAATPIVSALAVMLKSIRPSLSGAEVKRIILDSADLTDPTLPVLDFAKAIMNTIERVPGLPPEDRAMFNSGRRGMELYPSDLLVRICEHAEMTEPQSIVLLGDSGVPFDAIASHGEWGRIAHGGLGVMRYFDVFSFLRPGPALNWTYRIDRPRGTVNLSLAPNNSMLYFPSAAMPAHPAMSGLIYGTIAGTTHTESCRYFSENGQSYNPLGGDMVDNRRILFSNGRIRATLYSCIIQAGRASTLDGREDCLAMTEPTGPGRPHEQRLELDFVNLHHFVFDDEVWRLSQDLCSYFFDI